MTNSAVLLVPRGESAKEVRMCDALNDLDHTTSVTSYATMVSNKTPAAHLDSSIVDQFYSDDYVRIILSSDCAYEGAEAFAMVERVQQAAEEYYPDAWYLCGQSANMYDIKTCVQHDNTVVTTITMLSIYLILLVMTRNWLMPIFPILAIECSIWLNMCIPYFTGSSLSYLGYLIISTVQMGATIDYAILLTNTCLANREMLQKKTAIRKGTG